MRAYMNRVSLGNDDSQLRRAGDQHGLTDRFDPASAGLHNQPGDGTQHSEDTPIPRGHVLTPALGSVQFNCYSQDVVFE